MTINCLSVLLLILFQVKFYHLFLYFIPIISFCFFLVWGAYANFRILVNMPENILAMR